MRTFSAFSCAISLLSLIHCVTCGTVFKTILKPGSGPVVQTNQTVVVHYTGTLQSGEQFDSSREKGQPFEFVVGRGEVIPGWDAGVATMKIGERASLEIAPEDAYGAAGIPPVIPPSATLIFDIEVLAVKGSAGQSFIPTVDTQPGRGSQSQPEMVGQRRSEQSVSRQVNANEISNTESLFPPGLTGLGVSQQSLSQQGISFQGATQPDSGSQFLSGISSPGQSQLSQSQAQDIRLSNTIDMLTQNQGSSSVSAPGRLPISNQGMLFPSQGASTNMIDLATQGGGFTVGNQDFSSQILDLAAQSQGESQSQSQGQSQSQSASQSQSQSQSQVPSLVGLDSAASGSESHQSFSFQSSQGQMGGEQPWYVPAGQTSLSSAGTNAVGSQFQPAMPSSMQNPGAQPSSGAQPRSFQNTASLGRDSSLRNRGFGRSSGSISSQTALGGQDILGPPGFPASGMDSRGSIDAMGRLADRQRFGSSPPRFDSSQMFPAPGGRLGMPIRMMNTEQPGTQMQPVDRGLPFDRRQDRSMAGMRLPDRLPDMRLGGQDMSRRGIPGSGRGTFSGMSRSVGIGGVPDMGRPMGIRRRSDIVSMMRSRGLLTDPRDSMDPRFRRFASGSPVPGAPVPGPPGFPVAGMQPMAPRGIPPPMLLERLRMMRRVRGFR